MTSKLIVNSLAADTGVSTITFADQAKMGNAIFHSTGFTIGDSFLHSTGVNITNINATGVITATKFVGEVSVGSSITFEDNEKAYFGTGTDFSIYHNGSASYLDETGTGGLIAKTNTAFQVFNSAGSQAAFTVTPGGAVQLYHNTTERLSTDGNERLRIKHDGRTLINTTAVTNTNDFLTVKRPASSFGEMSMTVDANTTTGTYANAFIFTKSKNTYWNGLGFQSSHGHIGAIVGMRDSTGMNTSHKMRIEIGGTGINASEEKTWDFLNTGDLSISDGNLVLASGHGIDFSATADGASGSYLNSEVLADYERGRFEPRFLENGTTDSNYAWRYGQYVKIGNIVHVHMAFGISSLSGNFTTAFIGGLPFTMSSQWGTSDFSYVQLVGYSYASGYGDSGSTTQLSMELNQTHGTMHRVVQGQGKNNVNQSSIGGSQRFAFQFSYPTAS